MCPEIQRNIADRTGQNLYNPRLGRLLAPPPPVLSTHLFSQLFSGQHTNCELKYCFQKLLALDGNVGRVRVNIIYTRIFTTNTTRTKNVFALHQLLLSSLLCVLYRASTTSQPRDGERPRLHAITLVPSRIIVSSARVHPRPTISITRLLLTPFNFFVAPAPDDRCPSYKYILPAAPPAP